MGKIVECVPNFSEGKDIEKINTIVNEAKKVPGVIILDVEKDADHNRTVLTFTAPVETAVQAMFNVVKKSQELIDLTVHKGEHPRMGATDVAPFIPCMDSNIDDCIALAEELAKKIGEELGIPAYLYDRAAQKPERKNLAAVRKGQFEGLRDLIGKDPERTPDFGPNKIHPTAGAIAVGARAQIVNFNVNLATTDIELGKTIAKSIRESGGGLPCLRAKEIMLDSKSMVQISTVITDYSVTSINDAVNAIKKFTDPKGIKITGTELIGLTTQEAITDYAVKELNIENFNRDTQILEKQLMKLLSSWQAGANSIVDALTADTPTPGGGSAGAVCSAMGAGLAVMALRISAKSKKVEESRKPAMIKAAGEIAILKNQLQVLVAEDSLAYDKFGEAAKLPKESAERAEAMEKALQYAAEVPLNTAKTSKKVLEIMKDLGGSISPAVGSDFKSAEYLLNAGIKCAAENVRINTPGLKNKTTAEKLEKEIAALV